MDALPRDVARVAGPLLMGYLINWGLFGVLSMQIYIYYLAFAKDPLVNQVMVYGVYLFMVVQSILFSKSAFQTFGPGFGNLQMVDDITHIWFSVPIMCSVVALVVQGYYGSTIYSMSKDKRIPSVIVVLSVIQLAGGVFTGVVGHGAHTFSKFLDREAKIATAIWNTAGALCDIIIAVCMSYYYLSSTSQWRLKPTRVPIPIRVIVLSGALLASIASLNAALIQIKGHTYYQTTSGILGNTYANTLLALLNSRAHLARPDGYSNDEVSETYLPAHADRPPRSALVFAEPTLDGDATQTEVGMDTQVGHSGIGSRLTSTSGMTEDSRTMASADMGDWEESMKSTPKEDTGLNVEKA